MNRQTSENTATSVHETTRQEIAQLIAEGLQTEQVEVLDNSHLHVGHAGARSGGGHFAVRVVSAAFSDLSRIQRHRLVFSQVQTLMSAQKIHALEIEALSPEEN